MASKNGTRIVSLSLPEATLGDMDKAVQDIGYTSRSEMVRDAVRAFLREKEELAGLKGHVHGVLFLIYCHECAAQVMELRHRHKAIFKSMNHADFDGGDECCEVLMFCGEADEVKDSYNQLSALVGVKEARIFLA